VLPWRRIRFKLKAGFGSPGLRCYRLFEARRLVGSCEALVSDLKRGLGNDALSLDDVIVDPFEDLGEPELSCREQTHDEFKSCAGIHRQVKSIYE